MTARRNAVICICHCFTRNVWIICKLHRCLVIVDLLYWIRSLRYLRDRHRLATRVTSVQRAFVLRQLLASLKRKWQPTSVSSKEHASVFAVAAVRTPLAPAAGPGPLETVLEIYLPDKQRAIPFGCNQ